MSKDSKKIIPGNSNKSIYEIIKKCALNEKDEFELCKSMLNQKVGLTLVPFVERL